MMHSQAGSSLRITFILPVLNETFSLSQTVEVIRQLSGGHLCEILIVIAERTRPESLTVIENLLRSFPGDQIRVHKQRMPFLGGALREAFDLASGDHIMLMSSDLETDPTEIPLFIEAMQSNSCDIVAGNRWMSGGGFQGYSRAKLVLNFLFQQVFRIVFFTRLGDLTFAYRLYRKPVLMNIRWEELKHPFLLECLLKPLRLGARVIEVPCKWKARTEGNSASGLLETFKYLRIAVRARFIPRRRIRMSDR